VHLHSIKLTHFKNYVQRSLDLSPRLNCFVGLNGTGKTNLLDAVHVLCLTRSHRNLPDKTLIRHGESFFRVEGVFEHDGERSLVVVKYANGQRKEIERNGAPYPRLIDYVGRFPVVMIAPDDIALVQDGSEERRRFLDATLSQISSDYLQNLLTYNALLKQRNALLKSFAEHRRFDPALLEAIDQQMPAPASILAVKRREFTDTFSPVFQEIYTAIAGDEEQVTVALEPGSDSDNFAATLAANIERDRILERTAVGPHRDDLALSLHGHPVKKYASQGQLKSFLLALRLAQYEVLRLEKDVSPLLLLDDIFDKLDEQRVRQLIALLIRRNFGQIFITDTQRSRMEAVVSSFMGDYLMVETG